MNHVTFQDPATGVSYTWPVNPPPDGISPSQKQRQIDRSSNTANIGAVRQQGDDGAYVIKWKIEVFHADHEQALWEWYMLCKTQSIYLTDFGGEQFEGQIITLARQQIGVIAGPGDAMERKFYTTYDFEFDVWRFISGPMAAAGVTP